MQPATHLQGKAFFSHSLFLLPSHARLSLLFAVPASSSLPWWAALSRWALPYPPATPFPWDWKVPVHQGRHATSSQPHCPGVGINGFSDIKMVFQTSGDVNKMQFQRRNLSVLHPTQDQRNRERSREWVPFHSFLFSKVWKACWKVLYKLQTDQIVLSKIPVWH